MLLVVDVVAHIVQQRRVGERLPLGGIAPEARAHRVEELHLAFGAIRLTEQFLEGRSGAKGVKKLRKHVRAQIKEVLPVRDWRGAEVIGSGGTFTNLAGMFLARQGVKVRSVHGTRIPRHEVEHILEQLATMSVQERLQVPGLNLSLIHI